MGKWKFVNIIIVLVSVVFMILVLYDRYEVEPVVYFYILGGIVVCICLLLFIYFPLIKNFKVINKSEGFGSKAK